MIRYVNHDNQGARFVVTSKLSMPTKELNYPQTPSYSVFRGGDTVNPVFNNCQPTPYAARINEAPRADNAYTNRYEYNSEPFRAHAPAITL